jgi:hypothetical protein
VDDPLEAEIDRLFQLPLAEMVEARNALADQLRKAGDRAAATRIKALKRATPGAWAINQVFYRQRELLERARERAAQLQQLHAQPGLDRQQLSASVDAQRSALQAVVDAAMRCCEDAGVQAGPAQQRKVFSTLQAWLGGSGDEAPGRMTHDIEPSGFGAAFALGVAVPAPLPPSAAAAPASSAPPAAVTAKPATPRAPVEVRPDPRLLEQATLRLAERQQRALEAALRARDRRAAHAEAERALLRAEATVLEAEKTLADSRARVAERRAELARASDSAEAAERARAEAEHHLAQANAELERVRSS